jgi:hypothetical protein
VEQANSSLLFITGGSREKWPRAGLQAALLRWRADRVHFEAQDWCWGANLIFLILDRQSSAF